MFDKLTSLHAVLSLSLGLEAASGTDAQRALATVDLLARALGVRDPAKLAGDCPLCRTTGVFDEAWRVVPSLCRDAVEAACAEVIRGRGVDLTRLELDALRHLKRRDGIAVTREELLREVWRHEWTGATSNVVEAVVCGLRRKMGDRAAALETVRGVGYRLGPLD